MLVEPSSPRRQDRDLQRKHRMSVEKVVSAEPVLFLPAVAASYAQLGPTQVLIKRRRAEVEEIIEAPALAQQPTDPSYLTLSHTRVQWRCPWSEEFACLGDGDVLRADVAVKLESERLLHIRTKKRNKMREQAIAKIRITDTDGIYKALVADVRVLAANKSASTIWFHHELPPTLSIRIDNHHMDVFFTLEYHFQIIESLYMAHGASVISQVFDVMENITAPQQQAPTTVTPKLFYDAITEKTKAYPTIDKPPMVPELETELLRFQGTTLRWMLEREHMKWDDSLLDVVCDPTFQDTAYLQDDELVSQRLNMISVGFELVLIPSTGQKVWYNKFSGNVCSKETARKFLELEGPPKKGYGLLSEEMGLGKTVEVVALTLLNRRPLAEINEIILNPLNSREIRKAKTTLIVCPDSIVAQWYDELVLHAPGLTIMIYEGQSSTSNTRTPEEQAQHIATHDIVITSYNVVGREVHYALFNSHRSKRVRRAVTKTQTLDPEIESYIDDEIKDTLKGIYEDIGAMHEVALSERVDYTSPLVLLEFWRFVLDEVQMMGATVTNICTTATLIPRYHAWGVSGTPIRNGMSDLNSLLSFLKIHPFDAFNKAWKQLLECPSDFVKIFKMLSWRHTKAMVSADISIPGQQRVLLSIPFGPVEQNNYEELYKQFLKDVGLDDMGHPIHHDWEPTPSVNESMRNWLTTLRRVCCHASFGRDAVKAATVGFHTMDKVLNMMIEGSKQDISALEREIYTSQLEIGQVYEFIYDPLTALAIWTSVCRDLEEKVMTLRQTKDINEINAASFKSTLELLHRVYFFMGSSHYQIYTPRITQLVPGIEQQLFPGVDPNLLDLKNPEIQELVNGVTVYRVLNSEEMKHQLLEQEYYGMAQGLRRELLAEPIKNVNDSFEKIDHEYELHFQEAPRYFFADLELQEFEIQVGSVINQMNAQAEVINKWLFDLRKILVTPLLDTVTDPSGDEYEGSLFNQEHASVLLLFLQRSMKDRQVLVNGSQSGIKESFERVEETQGAMFDYEYSRNVEKEYVGITTQDSLRSLVIKSRSLIRQNKESPEVRPLSELVMKLKGIFDAQKQSTDAFEGKFRTYNSIYNLKITYFRRLQELSDNVKPFDSVTHANLRADDSINELQRNIVAKRGLIKNLTSRLKFLQSLTSDYVMDEKDKLCCICRSTITIGSITQCGHRYCKDCLDEWLKARHSCPICNSSVKKADIYNFTFNREEINVSFRSEQAGDELKQVYMEMDAESLATLNKIPLKHDYGSKVNAIVKQVLWLKRREPYVQIVIFSQWGQLLDLIGKSLHQNGINHLGSKNPHLTQRKTNPGLKESIALFKKDPNITCFLLNAKANASGLNLVNATHVFLCEPLVQTALELQAISRIHRIGQKKPTSIWTFSVQGSVEQSIVLLSARKRLEFKEQLESEEATKNSKKLVEGSGEKVDDSDLWNSFFSHKIGRLV